MENSTTVMFISAIENEENSSQNIVETMENEKVTTFSKSTLIKKCILALLFAGFIIYLVVDSLTTGYIKNGITSFLEWIEINPIAGLFVFIFVYFISTVLLVPGSILTLGSGFVFGNAFGLGPGVALATLAVFVGATAGATVCFILGRYLLRDWVVGLTNKYVIFEALDAAFDERGFRIMTLLRLSPLIPFNVINYIAGVTALSLRDYSLANFAILPGTAFYCFLGASAGSLTDSASSGGNPTVTIIVVVVGIVFGVIAVGATSYYAKKELNKIIAERELDKLDSEKHLPVETTTLSNHLVES